MVLHTVHLLSARACTLQHVLHQPVVFIQRIQPAGYVQANFTQRELEQHLFKDVQNIRKLHFARVDRHDRHAIPIAEPFAQRLRFFCLRRA